MTLEDLLGISTRIKILEQLVSFDEDFLSVDEISRMAEVSHKSVYTNMKQLESIGILEIKKEGSIKFKLNSGDERVLALKLIETHEFLRKSKNMSLEFETVELDELNIMLSDDLKSEEYNSTSSKTNQINLTFAYWGELLWIKKMINLKLKLI